MWFLRNPPKHECFFCHTEITEKEAYKLEYKHEGGTDTKLLCIPCSEVLNHIVDDRERYNEFID